MKLADILAQLGQVTAEAGPARVAEFRTILQGIEGLDPAWLDSEGTAAFASLHEAGDFSEEPYAQMAVLADVTDAAREMISERADAAAAVQENVNALSARVLAPAADDTAEDGSAPAVLEGEIEDPAAAPEPQLVSAAIERRAPSAPAPRVPLAGLPNRRPPVKAELPEYTFKTATEVAKLPAGRVLNSRAEVGDIVQAKMTALSRAKEGRYTGGILEIERTKPEFEFTGNHEADELVLKAATAEKRLPGGSLVAAGGWCAPSETIYTFCETASMEGMVTVPRIAARRGGLRWPNSPDFSAIYAGTGFCYTEAEVIAQSTDKPCYEIPCPTFTEVRLGLCGICVTVPILTERGFPELIRYTLDQVLAAHAHRVNSRILAQMEALAIANTVAVGAAPFAYGPGATASMLGILELQAEWMRYRRRLSPTRTIEVKLPLWARGILRSDLAKRNGVDLLAVSDERLAEFFRVRRMSVEYVYDWQDALATGNAADFGGGATPPDVWPSTVRALMAPAGTFFVLEQGIINVDGLYDSALLKRNMHLALFSEEGFVVGKQCDDAVVVTLPVCANGETGRQVESACPSA